LKRALGTELGGVDLSQLVYLSFYILKKVQLLLLALLDSVYKDMKADKGFKWL